MSWGVDEKGEPRGVSPAQNTERHLQSGARDPVGIASREDTPLTSGGLSAPGLPVPRPAPRPGVGI